jgi:hypothetical protein
MHKLERAVCGVANLIATFMESRTRSWAEHIVNLEACMQHYYGTHMHVTVYPALLYVACDLIPGRNILHDILRRSHKFNFLLMAFTLHSNQIMKCTSIAFDSRR